MEDVQSVPPSTTLVKKRPALVSALCAVIVISGLVMGAYLALASGLFAHVGTSIKANLDSSPLSPLVTLTDTRLPWYRGAANPFKAEDTLAHVEDAENDYYLIAQRGEQGTMSSSLYAVAKKDARRLPMAITTLNTLKYSLQFDADSRTFAYTSAPAMTEAALSTTTAWHVMMYRIGEEGEHDLGPGTEPQFLSGGAVVARNGENLVVYSLAGASDPVPLMTLPADAPFSVSRSGQEVALYNSLTESVDFFDVRIIGQASYRRSAPAPFIPSAMRYTPAGLLISGIDENQVSLTILEKSGITRLKSITVPPTRLYE